MYRCIISEVLISNLVKDSDIRVSLNGGFFSPSISPPVLHEASIEASEKARVNTKEVFYESERKEN